MHFEIVVGSVLGASEYVADAMNDLLISKGHSCNIHLAPVFEEVDFSQSLMVITSTHGAGELPDNIQPFAEQLANAKLENTQFIVIGLGDTSYDTYCQGGRTMQELLIKAEAKPLHDPLYIDVLQHPVPEELAEDWFSKVLETL
ncbi:FMN-binding protein MioC [Glaciecola sp. 1036]|uniref:FMN-binding protein MioC n=1 Tax=Alteromonadaceae TaxID=72275 RepID=UPI003D040E1E